VAVQPIPEGYHSVTPYLIVNGADRLVRFVEQAFSGRERSRMGSDDGGVVHAELQIGDSVVMLSDANETWPAAPGVLHLYVEDCDAVFQQAIDAGGTVVQDLATQFYGDRSGGVRDPLGNVWWITTHVEDVAPDEMERRAREWKGGGHAQG
jgi:PhnB protein